MSALLYIKQTQNIGAGASLWHNALRSLPMHSTVWDCFLRSMHDNVCCRRRDSNPRKLLIRISIIFVLCMRSSERVRITIFQPFFLFFLDFILFLRDLIKYERTFAQQTLYVRDYLYAIARTANDIYLIFIFFDRRQFTCRPAGLWLIC